jgi:excisionase family DNA binding protein
MMAALANNRELLTLEDVGRELHLTVRSVRRLIAEQGLPCVEFSERRRLVRREDLDAWLEARVVTRATTGPRSIEPTGRRAGGTTGASARPAKGRLMLGSDQTKGVR